MSFQVNPYALPLFLGTLIIAWLVRVALQHREARGAPSLLAVLLTSGVYVLGYALELSSTTVPAMLTWFKIQYLGVVFAGPALLYLTIVYIGLDARRDWPRTLGVAVLLVPVVTLLLALTNELHGAIWHNLTTQTWAGVTLANFDPGAWYLVNITYQYVLALLALGLLADAYRNAQGLYRRHIGLMSIGVSMPVVLSLAELPLAAAGLVPLDLTPYGLVIAMVFITWAVWGYRLLEIMPVARDTILQHMADSLLVLDHQQRIVYANAAAQRLVPARRAFIGAPGAEALPFWPTLAPLLGEDFREAEISFQTQPGEARYFDVQITPLATPQQACLILLRDVTHRRQTEEALRVANQRLEVLRRMDDELTRKLDPAYVAHIALDAAQRMSLADAGLLIALQNDDQLAVLHYIGPYDLTELTDALREHHGIVGRILRTQQAEWVPDVTADPDYIPQPPGMAALMGVPLLAGRKLIGVLSLETSDPARFNAVTFDVIRLLSGRAASALDNARIYAERAELITELEAFAHTVAHDLKNPLYAITGFVEFLLYDEQLTPEQRENFLERTAQSALKANAIIDALLLLAGLRREGPVKTEAVDMNDTAREALERLRLMADKHSARVSIQPDMPPAQGYAPWIEEVWVNYLSNAIKYGGDPPQVTLGYTRLANGHICYWVQDLGLGLSPAQQANLFKPFTRVNPGNIEGHGLGLSIVQRIVQRLNGEVGISSTPGEGSRFMFTLPGAETPP